MNKKIHELVSRYESLKSARHNFEASWQDISDLMMPYRGDITTIRSQGSRRVNGVFDTTAMQAADTFVNFLKGAIIPSGTDWVRLRAKPPFDGQVEIRMILDRVAQKILSALADSNFYTEAATFIRDFAVLGNGTLHVKEDQPTISPDGSTFSGLVFQAIPVGRMWWTVGHKGKPFFLAREIEMPAIDAFRFFGGKAGEQASQSMSMNEPMEPIKFLHFVYENENKAPKGAIKSAENKPWVSVYMADIDMNPMILKESGFENCPYIVARWMVVDGEDYGRGRGHLARADAMGINELRRQILIAAGKDLNPPLMVEHDTMVELDITPNGLMVTRPPIKMGPQYLKSETRYDVADSIARLDREQIQKAFLGDLLDEPETQPRSAEESRQRQSRALQRLSASADIVNYEFLDPMITSIIEIMQRAGHLPELDMLAEQIPNAEVEISYQSPFFTAQKASGSMRIQAFLERRLALYQATQNPVYLDDISPDQLAKYDAMISDIPAVILRTPEEVEAFRMARAERELQQQQQQQQMQQQQQQQQQQPPQQQQPQPGGMQ